MAAPIQAVDVIIAEVINHGLEGSILTKEVLTYVSATLSLKVLILAVDCLVHTLLHQPPIISSEEWVP